MATTALKANEQALSSASAQASRLNFIDHLRSALVILVVLHHVALVYGAVEPNFYYLEPPFNDPRAYQLLAVFVLFNQGWFMGAFFLLAGYFTPGSYQRKGAAGFLGDRLLRLGIPLLLFTYLLGPLSSIGFFLMPAALTGITSPFTWDLFPRLFNLGPLWFVAMLLVFSLGYALWRLLLGARAPAPAPATQPPRWLPVILFALGLALLSYLWRQVVPLGQAVSFGPDYFAFPTLAYLPQYLGLYLVGIYAARRDWFRQISLPMGLAGLLAAVLAGALLFPWAISGQPFDFTISDSLTLALGGGSWQSALYALWDSVFAVGLCLGLIPLFRRFVNGRSPLGTFLARHSYAVYILHIPVIVYLAYGLRNLGLAPLPKFALASLIALLLSYLAAFLLRKLPGAARVI